MNQISIDLIDLKHMIIRGKDQISLGNKTDKELLDEIEERIKLLVIKQYDPQLREVQK